MMIQWKESGRRICCGTQHRLSEGKVTPSLRDNRMHLVRDHMHEAREEVPEGPRTHVLQTETERDQILQTNYGESGVGSYSLPTGHREER